MKFSGGLDTWTSHTLKFKELPFNIYKQNIKKLFFLKLLVK